MIDTYIALAMILVFGIVGFCAVWLTSEPVKKNSDIDKIIDEVTIAKFTVNFQVTVTFDEQGNPIVHVTHPNPWDEPPLHYTAQL